MKGLIVVWFSCGAASAVAAKLTLAQYPNAQVRILNTPVDEEDLDNRRFLHDVQEWLGHPIEAVVNPKFPTQSAADVWAKRRFMSSPAGAPCTLVIKKEARQQFEAVNKVDWHVLGFTKDEQARHDRFIRGERENVLPVLINAGMSKQDCADYLIGQGLKLPRVYSMRSDFGDGFPNANCIGCVKVTSPTYWNHVRQTFPNVFEARAAQSREIGCRLVEVKGRRIFLDELDPKAKARPLKTLDFECGIFCEEPPHDH